VARDILVPVTSTSNPFLDAINARGIDPQMFGTLLTANAALTWGNLLNSNGTLPLTAGIPADEAAAIALARFAGVEAGSITASRIASAGEITDMLENNPGMVIFCTLASLTAEAGSVLPEGIGIIPIHVNANGQSDYF